MGFRSIRERNVALVSETLKKFPDSTYERLYGYFEVMFSQKTFDKYLELIERKGVKVPKKLTDTTPK